MARQEKRIRSGVGRRWVPWTVAGIATILYIAVPLLTWVYWSPIKSWLDEGNISRPIEDLRNLMLAAVGTAAALHLVPFTIWRIFVTHRQTETSVENTRIAARKELRERCAGYLERLYAERMAPRLAAIGSLGVLVREHPDEFFVEVSGNLCALARHPLPPDPTSAGAGGEGKEGRTGCPPDARASALVVVDLRKRLDGKGLPDWESGFVTDFTGANLAGVNFAGAPLALALFKDAALQGADFRDSDLSGARFAAAKLAGADMTSANLSAANLEGAIITGARLNRASLERAKLGKSDLKDADLSGADLTEAGLTGAYLKGADLTGADLKGADLTNVNLAGSRLEGVSGLTGNLLSSAKPSEPPASLPQGMSWPFERNENGEWKSSPR